MPEHSVMRPRVAFFLPPRVARGALTVRRKVRQGAPFVLNVQSRHVPTRPPSSGRAPRVLRP
jgi:hypothetical protein